MARPTSKITVANFFVAKNYFRKLLQQPYFIVDFKQRQEAEQAFDACSSGDYLNNKAASYQAAAAALQAWINKYATHKWTNFLALQRQRAFKKRKRLKALAIQENAYFTLKRYAKKVNLSLSNAIEKLAKTEFDRLCQLEWEQEKAKIKKVNR